MAKAEISKHFIFASLYLATWGKEDSRAHLFRAKMRHLAHTWLKIKLWWEASALCVSGKTIFCLKYATSQELLSCDYKSPVQSLCQCPTSRTTPTQCWPQFVPPFHKVWAQIFQKLFNSFLDSWSRMVLLKLSYLRIKRQTEGVSQYRERGRDRGRSFPRVAQELLEELGWPQAQAAQWMVKCTSKGEQVTRQPRITLKVDLDLRSTVLPVPRSCRARGPQSIQTLG